ncbi:uncharacterized protein LOC133914282 [Phragmites australis]|uniref:uncharacterized protein LOC133914282 n=1 Tax=Phragmites australis TaxID=29695 RepID=UPI002D799CA8|nr:uncharacterized protein LOC133914282 [Phragmites australis]
MVLPIANLSAVVTGAMDAAKALATEMLPAAVTRDAVVEAARAAVASFLGHLWAWLARARAVAIDNLPGAAAAARTAAGPWIQTADKFLRGLYGWFVTAAVAKLPDAAADKLMGDAAAWFMQGHGIAVYTTLALVFLGGAVCALTCRTMKGPGLGGARIPRAVFEASPRRYYAAVRTAEKARRGAASSAGSKLLPAGLIVVCMAYLAAKVFY